MATVSLDAWTDEVLVNAPGASQEAVQFAVERAVAEFLRRSGAWFEELPSFALRVNKVDYYLDTGGLGPILFVHQLTYNGVPLKPYTSSMNTPSGTAIAPQGWRGYLKEPAKVTIYPTMSATPEHEVVPFVSVGYSPECRERLPDIFMSHWYDTVLSGAVSRLLSQQNKPYTDATLALFHGKRFSAGIATARDMGRRQFMSVDESFTFPFWA